MPCVSQVAIIGGGIAGLSCAIGLAKVGVQCDVYEKANPKEGASLGISGRAAEALDYLGLYDPVYKAGSPFDKDSGAAAQRDSAGKLISPVRRPDWPGAKETVAIYRPALIDLMTDSASKLGVRLHYGITFSKIENLPDGVAVTLTNGEERKFDLLIGADGVSSATRTVVFPDSPAPEYTGQISIRWLAPYPPVDGESWYHSKAGRFGFYHLPQQQLIYVPSIIDMPDERRLNDDEVYQLFSNLLEAYTAPAAVQLRERLLQTDGAKTSLIARPYKWLLLPKPWYSNRVLLIGDAAHATTSHLGMGGGMAIEDAAVLAQSVEKAESCDEALDMFMERRFERVKTVVDASVALGEMAKRDASPAERVGLLQGAWKIVSAPY